MTNSGAGARSGNLGMGITRAATENCSCNTSNKPTKAATSIFWKARQRSRNPRSTEVISPDVASSTELRQLRRGSSRSDARLRQQASKQLKGTDSPRDRAARHEMNGFDE